MYPSMVTSFISPVIVCTETGSLIFSNPIIALLSGSFLVDTICILSLGLSFGLFKNSVASLLASLTSSSNSFFISSFNSFPPSNNSIFKFRLPKPIL